MSPEAINKMLHRNTKDGAEYTDLMPFSDCSSIKLADGDTKVAIDNMASWAYKYEHHTKKLAKTKFKNLPLSSLCQKLHNFLYHHFQYKIDGAKQKLKSPGCSWATRNAGIDCKSYSIFASTVLLNLGINHYLRRIVQHEGGGFTHVYVVIPKNQKTNDLKDGYYTIDGTVSHTSEVQHTKSDDVFMSVNGLAGEKKESVGSKVAGAVVDSVKPLLEYGVAKIIQELESCSGAAYDTEVIKLRLPRDLKEPVQKKVEQLGEALIYNNRARIQHLFNDLFKEIDLGIAHLRNEKAYSQFQRCEFEALTQALFFGEELKKQFDIVYANFKKLYPNYEVVEFEKTAPTSNRTLYWVVENATHPVNASYRYIVLKKEQEYKVEPVFPFEVNAHQWLSDNIEHLRITYNDGREVKYSSEITPVLNEVKVLRAKYIIGGEMLYYLEQPLQRKMYTIWLKYDNKYSEFLKQQAQDIKIANELALADYKKRFEKMIAEDKLAKKKKKDKMHIGIAAGVSALIYAMYS